ncbi:hypothetical protein Q6280_28685, partial [Klebsiella pneumoniae]|uniref:hypothetical protein n=1 Tax=Klebsiella pneumoniae TaxID=573 RepID=UPI00272FC568
MMTGKHGIPISCFYLFRGSSNPRSSNRLIGALKHGAFVVIIEIGIKDSLPYETASSLPERS